MKTTRYFLAVLLAITSMAALAQTRNEIIIADQPFWAEEIELTVSIENTDPIVAMQCDLRMPDFLTVSTYEGEMVLKDRNADHQLTVSEISHDNGSKLVRVIIYSPTNTPLKGHSGTVAKVKLRRPEKVSMDYGEVSVENGVLTTADSRNVLTGTLSGVLDFTDLPTLTVKASENVVTEGDTFLLTISTDHANEQALPITLQSEDNHRFDFPMQTEIPAGQTSVTIEVKTLDDDIPQLDLSNLFTVSAPEHHSGEILVLLKDNDIPQLTLTLDMSEVNELDGDGAVTATLRRTTNKGNKITVKISDDASGRLTYAQETIEMAKNVEEVTFHLGPVDNDNVDGDQTYKITAAIFVASCDCAVSGESAGFVQADLKVLDDDGPNGHQPTRQLADAVVTSFAIDKSEVEVGGYATFTLMVKNQGTDILPATNISLYNSVTGENVATLRTTGALAVGDSETLTRKVYMTHVGTQMFYAVVNETEEVAELRYANNQSTSATLKVLSPWTATITTDKMVYTQKDTVIISGQLMGKDIARASVDVYLINEGCREVATVVSDAEGKFCFKWTPYEYQSGHFAIGACYPGEERNATMAQVDIYGLRRADHSRISNEITIGETVRGNIMLENPGVLPLTGVKAEVEYIPGNCVAEVSIPSTIEADGTVPLQFSLLASAPSPEKEWERARVIITSKEGVRLPLTIYYYAQYAQGCLKTVYDAEINTTMTQGQLREYPLVITNSGKGSTGKMMLALPSCIKSPMGNTLSALEPGDTTTIVLNFVPQEAMQLNVPYTGMFSVNPEHGIGLAMNFSVMPVSEEKGTLTVDVTDELTYYTEEAPHVAGAEVVLRNPVTETVVAQGKTDENGLFSVTLPEGYYQLNVTADKHSAWKNNILIDPGVTNNKEVCLTYQAVTVTWTVEETEVEDEYQIVSTMDFEARVPVPVVQMNTVPERVGIDHLDIGESLIYHTIMTNKGLITAQDVTLYLPQDDEYFTWEPLAEYEHLDLPAQQSYVVPVRVTRVGSGTAASRGNRASGLDMPCSINQHLDLSWPCGDDMHKASVSLNIYFRMDCGDGGGDGWFPDGWGGGGNGGGGVSGEEGSGISLGGGCNMCLLEMLGTFGDCFLPIFGKAMPGLGCLISMVTCGANIADGKITADDIADCGLGAAGCVLDALGPEYKIASMLVSLAACVKNAKDLNKCMNGGGGTSGAGGGSPSAGPGGQGSDGKGDGSGGSKAPRRADVMPSFQEDYMNTQQMMADVIDASLNMWHEYFGDSIWINNINATQFNKTMEIIARQPAGEAFTPQQFVEWKPEEVSAAQLTRFVERLNNTRRYEQTGEASDNMMDMEHIKRQQNIVRDVEFIAIGHGYESAVEMFEGETQRFQDRVNSEGPGVCATIKLQITQHMTLTRQAFRGTLSIENGSDYANMEDIKLRLKVVSENGLTATAHEFEMHVESLDGFTGEADFDSGWALNAGGKGTATILFIPTKYAAPIKPVDYSFGGTLSYIDANSGVRVTRDLFPVTLTVKPSPELDLTYFMQRDIFGDDPLTEDVVEPMVPAEFTVVINNKGYGDATNVRMQTEQPKIIENDKGLYIDFEILSSTLKGQDRVLAMGKTVPTEFGTIPAHSQTWGSWELQSTLLGHFVTYNIEATHVTSYGNPDLSLLDQVTIHELIHGFSKPGTNGEVRAFLVNDERDFDDTPDGLYFSDATQTPVYTSARATTEAGEDELTFKLHVVPSREGWTYGSVEDPGNGRQRLLRIVRMRDQTELPLDNFWQTDRTLRDAGAPLYENRLHFVAEMGASGEDYLLTFEQRPNVELAVECYPDLPNEDSVITYPLQQLTVRFTKPIDVTTFDAEDIKLCHQGVPLDITRMPITRISDTDYSFNLTGLTDESGYYVLTVQTAKITDSEGYQGTKGKMATWIELLTQGISLPQQNQEADGQQWRNGLNRQYDLGGRRVGSGHRGFRIVNGKVLTPPTRH